MSWLVLLTPFVPAVAWLKRQAVVLLAIAAVVGLVAAFLAWTKSASREAGYQQCRAELRVQQAHADGVRLARGAEITLAASQADGAVFSLSRLDHALQLEADHVAVVAPRAGTAACAAAAARPAVRRDPPAQGRAVPSAPDASGGVGAVAESMVAVSADEGGGPDLSRVAVCLWNAPSTAGNDDLSADPGAAAAAIAKACAAEGDGPSGVNVRDALKNHITNATSCRQDRARLDALTAPLRVWQAQDHSLEN